LRCVCCRKTDKPIDFETYKSWLRSKGKALNPPPIPSPTTFLPSIDATIEENLPPILAKTSPPLQHPQPPSTSTEASVNPETEPTAGDEKPAAAPDGPYPTSFAQIVDLIQSGKPIPGIEDIPDTILTGQEGPSKEKRRMKPWEMSDVREGKKNNGKGLGADLFGGKKEA
jgi:hypothetical protein